MTFVVPREVIVVPERCAFSAKNSQSFVAGEKPGSRLTIASVGTSWSTVPGG